MMIKVIAPKLNYLLIRNKNEEKKAAYLVDINICYMPK